MSNQYRRNCTHFTYQKWGQTKLNWEKKQSNGHLSKPIYNILEQSLSMNINWTLIFFDESRNLWIMRDKYCIFNSSLTLFVALFQLLSIWKTPDLGIAETLIADMITLINTNPMLRPSLPIINPCIRKNRNRFWTCKNVLYLICENPKHFQFPSRLAKWFRI